MGRTIEPLERVGTKRPKFFGNGKWELICTANFSATIYEGWDGKCEGRNKKCDFLARESVNSSPILVRQWWRHFCLSLYYRKRGSAPILCVRYIRWERERERERERDTEKDGSDVTIIALKLAMNLHVPFAKIRTIGDEFTLSLAKNSHFSFLPSHFPSLPSLRGHHCGAEIRNGFTLSVAKKFFALFFPALSNGASHDEWSKTQDKRSNPAQFYIVLQIEKMNQIYTKNYWK